MDYGYGQPIGFLRFCDDPELACCQAEKDYLRLKAQEINLYEKAMELEYELTLLRKVVDAAKNVVGFGACHDENSFWSIKALQNTVENYEGWKKEGE